MCTLVDVLLPELIHIAVPPQLLMSAAALTLRGALMIVPTPGTAVLDGNALANASESQLAFNRTVPDLTLKIQLRAALNVVLA